MIIKTFETKENLKSKNIESKKIRNSSIELLKIISLLLIVLSHAVPYYGDRTAISYIDLNLATNNLEQFILIIFRNIGYIGNIIFVMCSSYFLLDKNQVKIKKIWYMIMDSLTISIIYLILYFFIYDIPTKDILKQFLPITFQTNWFIGCYILLYIIHPFLNKIIQSIKKESLLRINLVFIILYVCIAWILGGERYYYNNLVGFIIIYFIIAYNKIYLQNFAKNDKANKKMLLFGICGFVGLLVITNFIGLKIQFFNNKMLHWNSLINPFGLIIGLSLLNLFSNRFFENRFINYISSLSLLFYIIHENYLFRTYTKPLFYQRVFPLGNALEWVLIEAILLWLYGFILSIVYKYTAQKILYRMIDKVFNIFCNAWKKIENSLLKVN